MSGTLLTGGRVLTGVIFIAASIFKVFSLPSFRFYLHNVILSIFSVDDSYYSIPIRVYSIFIITMMANDLVMLLMMLMNLNNYTFLFQRGHLLM